MRRPTVALVLAVLLLLGCSSTPQPPDPTTPTTSASPPSTGPSATPTDSLTQLPVQASWTMNTTVDGEPVRISIVAVRRIPQGTVLDYAVALVDSPDRPAAPVEAMLPAKVFTQYLLNATLVAADDRLVYRPLADGDNRCLCTFWSAGQLQPGEVQLHQATFAELPADLDEILVQLGGGPLVSVRVTSQGQVPTVVDAAAVDQPAEPLPTLASTATFSYPLDPKDQDRRPLMVTVNRVQAGEQATAVTWTITAAADGPGLVPVGSAPLTEPTLPSVLDGLQANYFSGPGIRPAGSDAPIDRALLSTYKELANHRPINPAHGWRQCLCADTMWLGDELTSKGQQLIVVTNYPALPAGTTSVDVVFPGTELAPLPGVAVTVPVTVQVDDVPAQVSTVSLGDQQNLATYTRDQWPTPVPDAASIAALTTPATDDLIITQTQLGTDTQLERENVTVTLDATISFQPDSAVLTATAKTAIARVAAQLNQSVKPGSVVSVDGYVAGSDQGSPAVQQQLSTDRAKAVLNELQPQVNAKVTFTATGHGANDPVAPNDSEANRKLNRRVVISYRR